MESVCSHKYKCFDEATGYNIGKIPKTSLRSSNDIVDNMMILIEALSKYEDNTLIDTSEITHAMELESGDLTVILDYYNSLTWKQQGIIIERQNYGQEILIRTKSEFYKELESAFMKFGGV